MIAQPMNRCTLLACLAFTLLTGCQSKQDAAINRAKQQAAATGQAQQVISIDKDGTTTTTTVQPPIQGQTGQVVTTTVTPGSAPAANQPARVPLASGQQAQNQQPQLGSDGLPLSQASPAPGSNPIIRPADVNIPAGTPLSIRINQHISVKTSRPGDRFTGEVVEPVTGSNQQIVIPRGAHVDGVVDAAHRRGRFKGRSILQLRLVSPDLNGTSYRLDTHDLTRTKKGKGKRSAALIGGGAGLGMLVGGVASGGVGLLVGGLAGGGAGTALGGLTGNRDIEIPSESIVRFKLADDLVVQP
jgi:hypothetical protein